MGLWLLCAGIFLLLVSFALSLMLAKSGISGEEKSPPDSFSKVVDLNSIGNKKRLRAQREKGK